MAIGTDMEIFKEEEGIRVTTSGRPKVNRELGYQLLKAGYGTRYIKRVLKCSARTVRLMRQELKEKGDIEGIEATPEMDKLALNFEEECLRAVGISYYDWLKAKTVSHVRIFNFSKLVWTQIWEKPSLILVRDPKNPLGDQICMKWLNTFGEDTKRLRGRKKLIRYLFRFLGRMDLCDRYLTMSRSREPEVVREIPELTLLDFPTKLGMAIDMVEKNHGREYGTALRFKLVTQMRTGRGERELMGMSVGKPNGTWLVMSNPEQFRGEIVGKGREKWILEWIPKRVREEVYKVYVQRERGDKLFTFKIAVLRKAFKEATEKVGLPPMHLHDLRKVSITWLWCMGIPLEIATEINVGWKDLNTVKKHYLRMRELLKKSDRVSYREMIPDWFKDGLEEYLTD